MKIYLNRDNQVSGPFTVEEVRNLIYSGGAQRTDSARVEGEMGWQPLEAVLNAHRPANSIPAPSATVTAKAKPDPLPLEKLRDPSERPALVSLYIASIPVWIFLIVLAVLSYGTVLIVIGFVAGFALLFKLLAELWFAAYLKTNAVRVSPSQLPELHQVVQSCCATLSLPEPEVYVLQYNLWNSFAAKLANRQTVVLFSGALDSLLLKGNLKQVAWLVGHELGHHAAGHLNFVTRLASAGGWCFWPQLWHSRRCEFTCDRIGLYCAGSLQASQEALANATTGAQMGPRVNITEARSQWQRHEDEFFVKFRTLYSTHPHLLCRLDRLGQAAAEFGIAE